MRYDTRDLSFARLGTIIAGTFAVLLILYIVFVWVIPAPITHPFALTVWAHWPGWTLFGFAVICTILGVYRYSEQDRFGLWLPLAILFTVMWIVGGIFGSFWKQQSFLANTQIEHLSEEPETTGYRFLPMEVATTTATNKTTDSQVTPGQVEPLVTGNTATWVVPEEPNNFWTTYTGGQPGYLHINTTANTTRETTEYTPGFGICCFDGRSMGWTSVNRHYWADISPERYMTLLNGEMVIVQPYLTYYLDWKYLIPFMVKQYGGVLIFHADGTHEDLTPEEAAETYPDGRFYPHEMAEYFADSYQLQNGIWNYLFTHRDQPDVPKLGADDSGKHNQFPFLIPTDQGAEWYTAVEPYGASKSAYMSYYINATTGTVRVYKFTEPLVGPDQAESFVNNAFPELKNTSFYEPRPLVKNDDLYWMLSATASGSPDVQFTALVDAYSEDVIQLNNMQEVERVVSGEDPRRVGKVVGSSGTPSQEQSAASDGGNVGRGTTDPADGSNLSDEELVELLREAADRLEKQGQ